jgi:hypothetical protein
MRKTIASMIVMAILIAAITMATAATPTTSKIIIMLVDEDAYNDRERVLAPIYILGCETKDLGIINSVAAEIPISLINFLNSPKIAKIVPDKKVSLPTPPQRNHHITNY